MEATDKRDLERIERTDVESLGATLNYTIPTRSAKERYAKNRTAKIELYQKEEALSQEQAGQPRLTCEYQMEEALSQEQAGQPRLTCEYQKEGVVPQEQAGQPRSRVPYESSSTIVQTKRSDWKTISKSGTRSEK